MEKDLNYSPFLSAPVMQDVQPVGLRAPWKTWSFWLVKLQRNVLPIGFLVAAALSLVYPVPGLAVASWQSGGFEIVETINVCFIFICSGIVLDTAEIRKALKEWPAIMMGLIAILVITPVLAFACVRVPLQPFEFRVGLTVFSAAPTTLSQGLTLVGLAGGNQALALLLLVVSNILCIVTSQLWLKAVLVSIGRVGGVNPAHMMVKLLISILMPLCVGKAVREFGLPPFVSAKAVQSWVHRHKVGVGIFNNLNLVVIVWQQISAAQEILLEQSAKDVFVMMFAAILLVVALATINVPLAKVMRLDPREEVAILIMGSQKSMPFSITVIQYLPASFGVKGLMTLVPLIAQIFQLFFFTPIAHHYFRIISTSELILEANIAEDAAIDKMEGKTVVVTKDVDRDIPEHDLERVARGHETVKVETSAS